MQCCPNYASQPQSLCPFCNRLDAQPFGPTIRTPPTHMLLRAPLPDSFAKPECLSNCGEIGAGHHGPQDTDWRPLWREDERDSPVS